MNQNNYWEKRQYYDRFFVILKNIFIINKQQLEMYYIKKTKILGLILYI